MAVIMEPTSQSYYEDYIKLEGLHRFLLMAGTQYMWNWLLMAVNIRAQPTPPLPVGPVGAGLVGVGSESSPLS